MKVVENFGSYQREVKGLDITQDNGEILFYSEDLLVGKIDILIEDDLSEYPLLKLRRIDSYQKGYGRKIIDYLKDYCKSKNFKELFGACATGSTGFYEKIGAELVDGSNYYGTDKIGQIYFSIKII